MFYRRHMKPASKHVLGKAARLTKEVRGREVHGHHQETNRQPCCSRLASYDHDCLSGFYSVSKTAPLLWHTDMGTPRGGRPGSGKCAKSCFWADTSGFCGHSKVTPLPWPCPNRHQSRPPSVPPAANACPAMRQADLSQWSQGAIISSPALQSGVFSL